MKRRGFTLVELLAVLGVIAILASLLLPALSRAKAGAQRAYCVNNLKQLQIVWQLYTDDHEGLIPRNYNPGGDLDRFPSWVAGWLDYSDRSDNTNILNLVPGQPGCIGPWVRNPLVYKCPSDKS